MFAFVVYDSETKQFMAARDPIGIIPLYYGYGSDGSVWFASELKAITDHCSVFAQFPPGCYYDSSLPGKEKIVRYYQPDWMTTIPASPLSLDTLRESLISSVKSHLMSDVPFGVLLSGGLDSSLVASIACRLMRERGSGERLRSYAIGIEGSPDLAAAEKAAKYGVKELDVRVKGPGSGRESAITALQSAGMSVKLIEDVTPIPHNGCRPPKRRRV